MLCAVVPQRSHAATVGNQSVEDGECCEGRYTANEDQFTLRSCKRDIQAVRVNQECAPWAVGYWLARCCERHDDHLALSSLESVNGINAERRVSLKSRPLSSAGVTAEQVTANVGDLGTVGCDNADVLLFYTALQQRCDYPAHCSRFAAADLALATLLCYLLALHVEKDQWMCRIDCLFHDGIFSSIARSNGSTCQGQAPVGDRLVRDQLLFVEDGRGKI